MIQDIINKVANKNVITKTDVLSIGCELNAIELKYDLKNRTIREEKRQLEIINHSLLDNNKELQEINNNITKENEELLYKVKKLENKIETLISNSSYNVDDIIKETINDKLKQDYIKKPDKIIKFVIGEVAKKTGKVENIKELEEKIKTIFDN